MICDLLRDLARDVERNKIGENDNQFAKGSHAAHSSACDAETRKERFKYSSKSFFSQEKIFVRHEERSARG